MRQRNIKKIITLLAENLQMQGRISSTQKIAVWINYILQIIIIYMCLLVSIVEPQIYLQEKLKETPLPIIFFILRIVTVICFIILKNVFLITAFRLLIIISLYLVRTPFMAVPIIIQFIAQLYQSLTKEKRNLNFDSRLQCKFYILKISIVYLTVFSQFLVDHSQISKVPVFILFMSLVYFITATVDPIYSYKTKTILKGFAFISLLMSFYFMFVPLVPIFNQITLINHCIFSSIILLSGLILAISTKPSFKSQIIYKYFTNLQIRDKIIYIWDLIYFMQIGTYQELHFFVKNHRQVCLNPNCPLSLNVQNETNLEKIKKCMFVYLYRVLQKFSAQNNQIRRIYIFYRTTDSPKIMYLLKDTDLYEKIEQIRISNSFQQFKDISIQYQEMKQNEAKVLKSVKQYLNNYDYLLSYLQKQKLQIHIIESISKQLIKFKQYFLSFTSIKTQQNTQQVQQQLSHRKGQYQKVNQIINSGCKITLKTSQMINFMRTNYFNLPSIEAAECMNKNMKYINQEQQQEPILVISAQSYKLGKILNWNLAASKMLNYTTCQLKSMNVSDLVPKDITLSHQQIWLKSSLKIQVQQTQKHLSTFVFCFTKSMYVQICSLLIQTNCSISGNKWIIYFTPQFKQESIIVLDKQATIIGINKNAAIFGITLSSYGDQLNSILFENLTKKKQKIVVESGDQVSQNVIINQKSVWKVHCQTPTYTGMNPYYIILIEPAINTSIHKQDNFEQNQIEQNVFQKFQFQFDPYELKYTNCLQDHIKLEEKHIANSIISYEQNGMKSQQRGQKSVSYGQNINEMVYLNGMLEFKQNYQQVTQFQTHPNYINGNFQSQQNNFQMIKKQNLIENINKINQKYPTSVLFSLILVVVLFCIQLGLWVGILISTNQIYDLRQQQSQISVLSFSRRNIFYDIGSLGIYLQQNLIQSQIWVDFQLKEQTFQSLFSNIQQINGVIDTINGDISAYTNKNYLVNGSYSTLSKTVQSLSIMATSFSTSSFNLSEFILLLMNDIDTIQVQISLQVDSYYAQKLGYLNKLCQYLNIVDLIILILGLIWLYFIIRSIESQKYLLFKTLCFLNDEQLTKIQTNLQVNRKKIRQNQIDQILIDDYSIPQASQSLTKVKRLDQSLLNTKKILFYPIFLLLLILFGTGFIFSQSKIKDQQIISQVDPFIRISNQQRLIFSQIFMMLMTQVNIQNIGNKIQESIFLFQDSKYNIIQSLIQQSFSSTFLSFYQQIWFDSCQQLNVTAQCTSLFSGLINDNLDYSFIYVTTYINKVLISGQYLASTGYTNATLINQVKNSIQADQQKIVFLMFKLLNRLRDQFNLNSNQEVQRMNQYLNNRILLDFLLFTVSAIILFGLFFILIFKLKNLTMRALQTIICVVPYGILCRSKHFVEWYRKKFNDVY